MLHLFSLENSFKMISSAGVKYLPLILLCFTFSNLSLAQILYTDIPDATPNASFPLDLNNDGAVDFILQFDALDKILCYPQDQHAYAGEVVENDYLAHALIDNSYVCDSLLDWHGADTPGIMAWSDTLGNWVNANPRYLALRLNSNDSFYFGWVRLSVVTGSTSFTVLDYAYESSPNNCILTGQLPSHHEEITPISFTLCPHPFAASTQLQASSPMENATLTLYDVLGNQLLCIPHIQGNTLSISGDHLPSGTYFLMLEQEDTLLLKEKILLIK